MSKWSEELQENTRLGIFPGAMVKNENLIRRTWNEFFKR